LEFSTGSAFTLLPNDFYGYVVGALKGLIEKSGAGITLTEEVIYNNALVKVDCKHKYDISQESIYFRVS